MFRITRPATYSELLVASARIDPNGGGISLKIVAAPSGALITQFGYTLHPDKIRVWSVAGVPNNAASCLQRTVGRFGEA
jgi:hypothetical protein